jgi:hypothetical protein
MPLKPAPSPDKYEEKDERDAIAAACAAEVRLSAALILEAETYLTDFCASQ